jgi:cytochrome c-type biogenesis protein CcmH/NrfG
MNIVESELRKMRRLALGGVLLLAVLAASDLYVAYQWQRESAGSGLSISDIAEELDNTGEHVALKALVSERLKTHPNDLYAKWYLAEALYHLGELDAARKTYRELSRQAPGWRERCARMVRRIDKQQNRETPPAAEASTTEEAAEASTAEEAAEATDE